MSADELFEEKLREQERRSLPGEWREEILTNATVDDAPGAGARRLAAFCRVFTGLFPKPVTIPLAASWMAIGFLWLTAPPDNGRDDAAAQERRLAGAGEADGAALVAWLEQVRAVEAGIAEFEEAL